MRMGSLTTKSLLRAEGKRDPKWGQRDLDWQGRVRGISEANLWERGRQLSAGVILPVAKTLYLCDGHLGFTSGKTDLMGIFDSIRPQGGYPHIHPSFVVFARREFSW